MGLERKEYAARTDVQRILIVDPYPLVRFGLSRLIGQNIGSIICEEAGNSHEALEVISTLKPDMVIIEISLEGLSGLGVIEKIKMNYPDISILVYSVLDEFIFIEHARLAGANGYITKHETTNKVLEAIRWVLQKETLFNNGFAPKMNNQKDPGFTFPGHPSFIELLGHREWEVFRLIGQAYSSSEIAEKLCLSVKTVEAYRMRIRKKLNIKNSLKLVQQASQWVQNENKAGWRSIPYDNNCP